MEPVQTLDTTERNLIMSKEKYIFLSSPVMRSPQIFGLPDESLHLDFITVHFEYIGQNTGQTVLKV